MPFQRSMRQSVLLLLAGLSAGSPAQAGSESEACIQTKTWSHYETGWALRTSTTSEIEAGAYHSFAATLYGGREYMFEICGDSKATLIDLVLYGRDGKEIARAKPNGREPVLEYKPEQTQGVFVVAQLRAAKAPSADVALVILHR